VPVLLIKLQLVQVVLLELSQQKALMVLIRYFLLLLQQAVALAVQV
jgi:hypothetical protein